MKKKHVKKSWHWADVDKSDRLKRVVRLLTYGWSASTSRFTRKDKFSSREIAWYANVNSGNACLSELRKNGIEIKSATVKGKEGNYKVHWIEK